MEAGEGGSLVGGRGREASKVLPCVSLTLIRPGCAGRGDSGDSCPVALGVGGRASVRLWVEIKKAASPGRFPMFQAWCHEQPELGEAEPSLSCVA